MREIGGYFELDQFIKRPYYNKMIELNTGRNAVIYLVKAKGIKKIYIPHYLCDSISGILDRYAVEYEKYSIDKNFHPIFEQKLDTNEFLYIVNYFGQIDNTTIKRFSEKYGSIIIDNTQSFFQKPIVGIDTIYSLRKYFGLPDGAYLSTDCFLDEELENEKSSHRMRHILGRFEEDASKYYENYKTNDESFKTLSLNRMSRISQNVLGAIDYEKVRSRRNDNFMHLEQRLSNSNLLDIRTPEGPFCYPYYMENGLEVKTKLAEKKIYIPTLWPNVLTDSLADTLAYDYAAKILPLPCDQRYDIADMDRIIKELKYV
jgi:hypothetical protein